MPTEDTNIGWCDDTWNPVHGCSKVSEGCANCYAATISQRYEHTTKPWTGEHAAENVQLQDHHLEWPGSLSEPRRIFVNSMSDLFHAQVPADYIHRIMDVIDANPEHVFIALTKHGAENGRLANWTRWPDNLWMGVSVEAENRWYRVTELLQTDAAVRWVSFEPLVDRVRDDHTLAGIDWAVIGGESGSREDRRPMNHAWARTIRDMARDVDAAVFVKQSSGPRQGHQPMLAEAGPDVDYARANDVRCSELRELPRLTTELRAARPDLAAQEVTTDGD